MQLIPDARAEPAKPPEAFPDETMVNSRQTRGLCGGVTMMCLWRWQRDDRVRFPRPVKINRRNYWRLGDLRRWQAERIAAGQGR